MRIRPSARLWAAFTALTVLGGCAGANFQPAKGPVELAEADMALARAAYRYMETNRLKTGLVSSAAGFPATTMWDVGSQLAGMVGARELGLLSPADFDAWMKQVLATLATLPLAKNELPNKAYNAETLLPVDYGALAPRKEIGFSAIDLARLARWLDLVATRYPAHAEAARAATARWKLERLTRDGQLMGTHPAQGQEQWVQEGRSGYEQYAVAGLATLGVKAPAAADPEAHVTWLKVTGVPVPVDKRDLASSGATNFLTSEPYVLEGMEGGFKAMPPHHAGAVLAAQQRRHEVSGFLTAWSEDNLDRAPYFVYNCLYANGERWVTLDAAGKEVPEARGSSLKAAVGWHMLYRTDYTTKVYTAMRSLFDPAKGAFAGTYESPPGTNRALTLNTNAIVLEALLYGRVGRPLAAWAAEAPR